MKTARSHPLPQAPGKTASGETVPRETVPRETVPRETVPGETVPGETVPGEKASGEKRHAEPIWLSPEQVVEPLDPTPFLDVLDRRFGMPRSAFEGFVVYRANRSTVWIVDRDLRLPKRPEPHSLGMPFFYANMEFPRPTTAAAVRFGPLATRNAVDLEEGDLPPLLYEKSIPWGEDRPPGRGSAAPAEHGYVLLRHRGLTLGLGSYRPADEQAPAAIKSLLPRSWVSRLGVKPPEPAPDTLPELLSAKT